MNLSVAYSTDDAYAPLTGISILSLLKSNHSEFDSISIHLLDYKISHSNMEKIRGIIDSYSNVHLFTYDIHTLASTIPALGTFPLQPTYGRLFLAILLPATLDVVLYLDSDTAIYKSLKDLMVIDISTYTCAGVIDIRDHIYLNQLGMEAPYYNTGILLINLTIWKRKELHTLFAETCLKINTYADQDYINVALEGTIRTIDLKYNVFSAYQTLSYKKIHHLNHPRDFYEESDYAFAV